MPAARDFVTDAYAHCKFIGCTAGANRLFDAVGLADHRDEGFIALDQGATPEDYLQRCRGLRYWDRLRVSVV